MLSTQLNVAKAHQVEQCRLHTIDIVRTRLRQARYHRFEFFRILMNFFSILSVKVEVWQVFCLGGKHWNHEHRHNYTKLAELFQLLEKSCEGKLRLRVTA